MSDRNYLTAAPGCVTLTVRIQPRASRNEIIGVQDDSLKIRLTSPPVEGAANRLCIDFLAGVLGVPRSGIRIVSGEKGRRKVVRIDGATVEDVLRAVEEAQR